jgi:hypothetical protein
MDSTAFKRSVCRLCVAATGAALLVGLPLAGVLLAERPLADYLEFPPLTQYVRHSGFSLPVFLGLATLIAAVVGPFLWRVSVAWRRAPRASAPARAFPWWGWAALAFGATAWLLAWTRFAWFAPCQRFTFSPLWFAYILVVNALIYRRTGRSMLTHEPRRLASLFAASAAFWWYFEYLNRFVQNWHYEHTDGLSAVQYFWFATLPFATVLPAVMGTVEWLETMPRSATGLERAWVVRVRHPRRAAAIALTACGAGLAGIGVWPDLLFPLLWVSPLVVIVALRTLCGFPTLLHDLAGGDWRRVFRLALAALICGFFWEMWNWQSLARWVYSVPFVNRFHVFEMPILGYAGYLPFGVECAVIADAIMRRKTS